MSNSSPSGQVGDQYEAVASVQFITSTITMLFQISNILLVGWLLLFIPLSIKIRNDSNEYQSTVLCTVNNSFGK